MYPFDTPFYHTLTALSTIETRQAAFTIVPGSHTRAREWLAGLSATDLERMRDDGDFRGSQSQAFLASGAVDRAEAVEVLMDAGDTCIFELLCTHSASRNERDSPRHVIFQTFFDRAGPYSRIVNQQKPAGIWCATFFPQPGPPKLCLFLPELAIYSTWSLCGLVPPQLMAFRSAWAAQAVSFSPSAGTSASLRSELVVCSDRRAPPSKWTEAMRAALPAELLDWEAIVPRL